jgi:hypothetical protein
MGRIEGVRFRVERRRSGIEEEILIGVGGVGVGRSGVEARGAGAGNRRAGCACEGPQRPAEVDTDKDCPLDPIGSEPLGEKGRALEAVAGTQTG